MSKTERIVNGKYNLFPSWTDIQTEYSDGDGQTGKQKAVFCSLICEGAEDCFLYTGDCLKIAMLRIGFHDPPSNREGDNNQSQTGDDYHRGRDGFRNKQRQHIDQAMNNNTHPDAAGSDSGNDKGISNADRVGDLYQRLKQILTGE